MASKKVLTDIVSDGNITSTSFIKSGGTSSQYLMADGSISTGGTSANNSLVTINTATGLDGATTFNLNQAGAATVNLSLDFSELPQNQEVFELIGRKSDGTLIRVHEQNYMAAKGRTGLIIGNGFQNNFTVNHNLLSNNLIVNVWDHNPSSAYYKQIVQPRVEYTDTNNVVITFKKNVASTHTYKVEILKVTQYSV